MSTGYEHGDRPCPCLYKRLAGARVKLFAYELQVLTRIVEIRDAVFQKNNEDLTFSFKLANSRSEEEPAVGYIHVIAMGTDKKCPDAWNNSRNSLSNCTPVNYRNGQQFLIQRFRPYRINFKKNSDSELPSFIKILVYDQSGLIIFEKELPVINVSEPENI